MRLMITRENLTKLVAACAAVAKPKSPQAILACLLLETDSKGVKASASDLFQEVVTHAPADISQAGGVVVNAKDLLDRVRSMPSGPIDLSIAKEKLVLTSGKRRHTMPVLGVDEFPAIVPQPRDGVAISAATLKMLLRRTKFAMSADSTRGPMHGLLLEFEEGKIRAVATDSHRLPTFEAEAAGIVVRPPIVLPAPSVEALFGFLDEGDVTLTIGSGRAWFGFGETTFCTKLVEGEFPPYRYVIQSKPPREFRVLVEPLLAALRSVEKASADDSKKGFLKIDVESGLVKVSASGKGEATDEIEAAYDGPSSTFGIFCPILCDALTGIESETARFNIGGDLDPIWVRPETGEDCLQLVMPARP